MHYIPLTFINMTILWMVCSLYRRNSYRERWKYQLIGLMAVMVVIQVTVLGNAYMRIVG